MHTTAIVADGPPRRKGSGWTMYELLLEYRNVVAYLEELAEQAARGEDVTARYARANSFADELAEQITERGSEGIR